MSTEIASIDPVEAKAFEIRRFAIEVRRKLEEIEDIDRLRELESVLVGARHRLKQLNEDVIEADRTRVLVVQRIGVLLGPATLGRPPEVITSTAAHDMTNPSEPMTHLQRERDYEARTIAAYPSIVERAIAQARVSVRGVFKLCQQARLRETAPTSERPDAPDVQRGQWWKLGDHRLYCGESTDAPFIEKVRQAEPLFVFADVSALDGLVWAHDYLVDVAPVVAVRLGVPSLVDFARVVKMPYRWTLAACVTNGSAPGALGFNDWIPVYLFAKEDGGLYHEAHDVLTVTVDPRSLATKLLKLFTSSGDVVADPFLGNGAMLLAADKADRVCIGAEANPVHCGETIVRYGKEVSLL